MGNSLRFVASFKERCRSAERPIQQENGAVQAGRLSQSYGQLTHGIVHRRNIPLGIKRECCVEAKAAGGLFQG
jgi:hypothetical protein